MVLEIQRIKFYQNNNETVTDNTDIIWLVNFDLRDLGKWSMYRFVSQQITENSCLLEKWKQSHETIA